MVLLRPAQRSAQPCAPAGRGCPCAQMALAGSKDQSTEGCLRRNRLCQTPCPSTYPKISPSPISSKETLLKAEELVTEKTLCDDTAALILALHAAVFEGTAYSQKVKSSSHTSLAPSMPSGSPSRASNVPPSFTSARPSIKASSGTSLTSLSVRSEPKGILATRPKPTYSAIDSRCVSRCSQPSSKTTSSGTTKASSEGRLSRPPSAPIPRASTGGKSVTVVVPATGPAKGGAPRSKPRPRRPLLRWLALSRWNSRRLRRSLLPSAHRSSLRKPVRTAPATRQTVDGVALIEQ